MNKAILDFSNNEYISDSFSSTLDFGIKLVKQIRYGVNIVLEGELGTGKTSFTKGIAKGLEIETDILSPSFTLINFYQGKNFNLCHCDLYRITSEKEFYYLGLEEYFSNENIVVIEWGEKLFHLIPDPKLIIKISLKQNMERCFKIYYD